MSKSFSYIISSRDGISSGATANSFNVILNGLPSHIRRFACEVKSFAIPIDTMQYVDASGNSLGIPLPAHILMLTATNLISSNEIVSGNRSSNIVAMCELVTGYNNNVGIKFIIDNFNGKLVTFNLLDERFVAVDVSTLNHFNNTAWTLVLELTPLED